MEKILSPLFAAILILAPVPPPPRVVTQDSFTGRWEFRDVSGSGWVVFHEAGRLSYLYTLDKDGLPFSWVGRCVTGAWWVNTRGRLVIYCEVSRSRTEYAADVTNSPYSIVLTQADVTTIKPGEEERFRMRLTRPERNRP